MKKKLIGLSILLLVLLLGLSTISYADVNHVWTENQLKNVIYNYLHLSYNDSYIESYFNYHATEITNLVNKMNSNNYVYIIFQRSGPSNFFIGYGNTNSIWWNYNGCLSMTNASGFKYWVMPINNTAGWENSNYWYSDRFNTNYYYFSKPIYNNSSAGLIVYNSGMHPESFWTGPYLDDHFDFDYNMNQTFKDIIVGNDTYTLPIRQQGDNTLITLGELEQLKYLDYIMFEKMRYNKYTNMWETFYAENLFSGDWGTDDDILTVKVGGGNVGNILCQYTFYSNSNSFDDITAFYYVINLQTTYSGDVIDVSGTFGNDDYYNNYDDNINNIEQNQQAQDRTDDVINTITDDSQVDNILNEFSSGDYNDLAARFGFRIFGQEYFDFIRDTVTDIVHVLEESEDVYFDYSMHGETPTRIYASDFTTPPGALKTFLSTFLVACTVYAFYKYMADLLELLSTGNIETALQEFKVDRNIFKM